MKAGDVIKAYAAIGPLMEKEFTAQESYELIKLKRKLQAEAEIFSEHEKNLINIYADKDESGKIFIENGEFKGTGENAEKLQRERKAMCDVDIAWDCGRILIHAEKIKPAIMEALVEFIDFI